MKRKILGIFVCMLLTAIAFIPAAGKISNDKTLGKTATDCSCLNQQAISRNSGDLRGLIKLTASDGEPQDFFGWSVSIDGDCAIVGAPNDDDMGLWSGSAYIFRRNAGIWSLEKKLTAPDGISDGQFGRSVSIDGDCAIVGAPNDDDMGIHSGSAYIFRRSAGIWAMELKLTAPDGISGVHFGWSVSIDGDNVIIGTPRDDDMGGNSGSAYIYTRVGGIWSLELKLTAPDGAADDWFGCSVSIDGDYTIIGAPYDDDLGVSSGSAYIYRRDAGSWPLEKKLTAFDGAAGDEFGVAVSIKGDHAIIGALLDDDMGHDSGSAYIFWQEAGIWAIEKKLTAPDGIDDAWFGLSVSIDGCYSIMGAPRDDDMGYQSGSAYIYECCCISIEIQKGFQIGVHAVIKNNCNESFYNLKWSITLNGGLIPQGQVTTGTIPVIHPADSVPILGPIFGIGLVEIIVVAGCAEEKAKAFVFGPFIIILP